MAPAAATNAAGSPSGSVTPSSATIPSIRPYSFAWVGVIQIFLSIREISSSRERLPLRAVYISRMQSRAFRRASALRRISWKSPSVVPLGLW